MPKGTLESFAQGLLQSGGMAQVAQILANDRLLAQQKAQAKANLAAQSVQNRANDYRNLAKSLDKDPARAAEAAAARARANELEDLLPLAVDDPEGFITQATTLGKKPLEFQTTATADRFEVKPAEGEGAKYASAPVLAGTQQVQVDNTATPDEVASHAQAAESGAAWNEKFAGAYFQMGTAALSALDPKSPTYAADVASINKYFAQLKDRPNEQPDFALLPKGSTPPDLAGLKQTYTADLPTWKGQVVTLKNAGKAEEAADLQALVDAATAVVTATTPEAALAAHQKIVAGSYTRADGTPVKNKDPLALVASGTKATQDDADARRVFENIQGEAKQVGDGAEETQKTAAAEILGMTPDQWAALKPEQRQKLQLALRPTKGAQSWAQARGYVESDLKTAQTVLQELKDNKAPQEYIDAAQAYYDTLTEARNLGIDLNPTEALAKWRTVEKGVTVGKSTYTLSDLSTAATLAKEGRSEALTVSTQQYSALQQIAAEVKTNPRATAENIAAATRASKLKPSDLAKDPEAYGKALDEMRVPLAAEWGPNAGIATSELGSIRDIILPAFSRPGANANPEAVAAAQALETAYNDAIDKGMDPAQADAAVKALVAARKGSNGWTLGKLMAEAGKANTNADSYARKGERTDIRAENAAEQNAEYYLNISRDPSYTTRDRERAAGINKKLLADPKALLTDEEAAPFTPAVYKPADVLRFAGGQQWSAAQDGIDWLAANDPEAYASLPAETIGKVLAKLEEEDAAKFDNDDDKWNNWADNGRVASIERNQGNIVAALGQEGYDDLLARANEATATRKLATSVNTMGAIEGWVDGGKVDLIKGNRMNIINNPAFGATPTERGTYYDLAVARATEKQDGAALEAAVNKRGLVDGYASGGRVQMIESAKGLILKDEAFGKTPAEREAYYQKALGEAKGWVDRQAFKDNQDGLSAIDAMVSRGDIEGLRRLRANPKSLAQWKVSPSDVENALGRVSRAGSQSVIERALNAVQAGGDVGSKAIESLVDEARRYGVNLNPFRTALKTKDAESVWRLATELAASGAAGYQALNSPWMRKLADDAGVDIKPFRSEAYASFKDAYRDRARGLLKEWLDTGRPVKDALNDPDVKQVYTYLGYTPQTLANLLQTHLDRQALADSTASLSNQNLRQNTSTFWADYSRKVQQWDLSMQQARVNLEASKINLAELKDPTNNPKVNKRVSDLNTAIDNARAFAGEYRAQAASITKQYTDELTGEVRMPPEVQAVVNDLTRKADQSMASAEKWNGELQTLLKLPSASAPAEFLPADLMKVIGGGKTVTVTLGLGDRYSPELAAATGLEYHQGIDTQVAGGLGAKVGNPFEGAKVIAILPPEKSDGYGNLIKLRLADGSVAYAAHFNTVAVKVGQTLKRGDTLGGQGKTGTATGVHTHWEIRGADGKAILDGAAYNAAFSAPAPAAPANGTTATTQAPRNTETQTANAGLTFTKQPDGSVFIQLPANADKTRPEFNLSQGAAQQLQDEIAGWGTLDEAALSKKLDAQARLYAGANIIPGASLDQTRAVIKSIYSNLRGGKSLPGTRPPTTTGPTASLKPDAAPVVARVKGVPVGQRQTALNNAAVALAASGVYASPAEAYEAIKDSVI